jgi:hypothetical protein
MLMLYRPGWSSLGGAMSVMAIYQQLAREQNAYNIHYYNMIDCVFSFEYVRYL